MSDWTHGPGPRTAAARLALARELARRARARYRGDLVAVGAYGSIARGDDGPYSDLELHCVVGAPAEQTFELVHDGWKIEIDVVGREQFVAAAGRVDESWAVTHEAYLRVMALDDPTGLFATVAGIVRATPGDAFEAAIRRLLVDDLYEATGKLRNARARGHHPPPGFVYYVARLACQLVGLINRRTYATASRMLADSLLLPDRPSGHDELCQLCLDCAVGDGDRVFAACEALWSGAAAWARDRGISIASPSLPF
jgi:kanamycin nucleotidyltransferase